ncbi:hypothetical protein T492DRAFT_1105305 [Pavlovales sp. CCMP2436]|nr:hypothetical protein T492DRAFT_1105305 [Pavlovales sp. CCMP2436]
MGGAPGGGSTAYAGQYFDDDEASDDVDDDDDDAAQPPSPSPPRPNPQREQAAERAPRRSARPVASDSDFGAYGGLGGSASVGDLTPRAGVGGGDAAARAGTPSIDGLMLRAEERLRQLTAQEASSAPPRADASFAGSQNYGGSDAGASIWASAGAAQLAASSAERAALADAAGSSPRLGTPNLDALMTRAEDRLRHLAVRAAVPPFSHTQTHSQHPTLPRPRPAGRPCAPVAFRRASIHLRISARSARAAFACRSCRKSRTAPSTPPAPRARTRRSAPSPTLCRTAVTRSLRADARRRRRRRGLGPLRRWVESARFSTASSRA